MNMIFIHTFSIYRKISFKQVKAIYDKYKGNIIITNPGEYNIFALGKQGIRMEIRKTGDKEKQYDSEHHSHRITLIINPHEILNNGMSLGYLPDRSSYQIAIKRVETILNNELSEIIEGAEYLDSWKIYRLDLTKDIKTPNDEYTTELIRVMKLKKIPYGFFYPKDCNYALVDNTNRGDMLGGNILILSDENSNSFNEQLPPDESLSYMYYNRKQDIKAKAYNKIAVLKQNNDSLEKYNITGGLLRLEVSLSRQYLKKHDCLNGSNSNCIQSVLNQSSYIFDSYLTDILEDGHMLSKTLLQKYID